MVTKYNFFSLHSNRQFAFGPPSFSIIKNASQGSLKKWKENFTQSLFLTLQFRGDLGSTLWVDMFDRGLWWYQKVHIKIQDPSNVGSNSKLYFEPIKGQIFSKCLIDFSLSPKKRTKQFVFNTSRLVFVCFLGESVDT